MDWIYPLALLAIVALPWVSFAALLRRVRRGALKRGRAIAAQAGAGICPTLGFTLFFFGLVGIEEVTGAALVPEGLGRSFLILVALGLLVWLVSTFAFVTAVFLAGRRGAPESAAPH